VRARLNPSQLSPFHVRVQARAESAPLLRERLCLWLQELGAAGDEVFDVSLAATEAFANAVEHPHEPTSRVIEVDGRFADDTVTVTLRDFGSWGHRRRREEGGYGFPLMRNLVDAVKVDTGADGTAIILERRIPRRRRARER
jgi:anti-sigma regulatory factor (Ser/Thr protein kinase)